MDITRGARLLESSARPGSATGDEKKKKERYFMG